MKVCIASWAPHIGGAEIAAERLALGLMQAGHDVLLVVGTDGDALRRYISAGIRCTFIAQQFTDKWHWLRYLRSRNAFVRVLRAERPDILHSNDLPTHQMASDAARRVGIPRVCHHRFVYDGNAIDWFNKYGAERHVFVSRALRDILCSKSSILKASPTAVVYDGLCLEGRVTPAERKKARAALNLPDDKVLVVFSGQISHPKGIEDLLRSWRILPEPCAQQAELLLVGDDLAGAGKYRLAMERLGSELGIRARFVGFQTNPRDWLLASDIAVVPSHFEALGNATLEAMALSLPVVGTAVGGIPEMVVDGETGLLVPVGNPQALAAALTRLISNQQLRKAMGHRGRLRCEQMFSIEKHVLAMIEQYELAIESKSNGYAVR